MDADARAALAAAVLARSTADATEVTIVHEHRALTRFTRETIHQNVDVADTTIRVRAIVGSRTGVATTNVRDHGALDALVTRAREIAQLAPAAAAPIDLGTDVAQPAPSGAYVAATAFAEPTQRAEIAGALFAEAPAQHCWSAGFVSSSASGVTIASSRGRMAHFDGTDCGANVKMTGADATGFAERYANAITDIDGAAIGARALAKARASAHPIAVEPGDWTVILEPPALGELVAFLAMHCSAQAVHEGSSFLSGRMGERVLGTNVRLRDDYAHPLNPDMPFDWEGEPKAAVTLIDDGIARNVVTDRAWAQKLATANTGHGLPAPNAYGPMPRNLVIDPGSDSLDTLIANTKRGLLVTRLWYVRLVDQRQLILTGMTRDGTFLIENGVVTRGVRNLRFNQSLPDALSACTFSADQARTGGYAYAMVVPSVRFDHFHFASTTDY